MADEKKLSPVEGIKSESRFLRGTIQDDLANDSDQFDKSNMQLLKFHGTYQQDDRDSRNKKNAEGKSVKSYSMMTRTRVPGGRLTSEQMLAHLDLCEDLANATLKCTTRQALQMHGVLKSDLREAIQRINKMHLSTLAACGDVNRNVMCCPAPLNDSVHVEMRALTDALKDHLAPRTPGYYELWIQDEESGEKTLVGGGEPEEVEPIYGPTYLPRKFKIGIALPEDNCIDIYANDLGFLAVVREGKIIGYNVSVGGGMGTTPSAAKTFPALAKRMAFVTPEQAIGVAEAVVKVQRDFGNREDRKIARLKYLIANEGVEWFRGKVEEYYGEKLQDCTADEVHGFDDHMGWFPQGDGKFFYGLNVESGRLFDSEDRRWKAAIRAICKEFNPGVHLTAHQSILFTNLEEAALPRLQEIIKQHGLPLTEEVSTVRRWSMSCVALPTCGLAVAESERVLPELMSQFEVELAKLGLESDAFTVRITGCPNGCARPYNADIGLVGKTKAKYTIFLGGQLIGTRMAKIYKDLVPFEEITSTLVPIFTAFKEHRQSGETLGDFCDRVGNEQLASWSEQLV
ncbi:NADPH-dependent assimilatory sulfite reductase hemoprotein subunit [Aureliella helgolandensis]|uniref:Sulfite reductase [NADPH] hemoprotein beta-component n=1 Tax=Aureliella helgolandensis TaxID=2527968 RepID=A0A518G910_9BACT|nr:NADPH-dependent assimilatory sulfite reductase hemoprotein subunit [Aureliella helgolandensis]QDV25088.1 Sulfite reductase [NADPH] hemoprotein beta-component [Aureliella helgolandensis]